MYTWNWKTGHLNYLSTLVGLDLTGWILSPGRWIQHNANSLWARYIYLVGVRQENEELTQKVLDLEFETIRLAEKAKSADRMASLLRFTPEAQWDTRGCRVIGQKLGPNAILETILVDVGSLDGAQAQDPVVSTKGVVGRIIKPGLNFSNVLLLTDAMSKIPVITSTGRVPAIVQGQGAGAFLEVKFIPRNDEIAPGEILLTSGQGGVFPKGIPVARVIEVAPSDVSLFQKVYAEPLLILRSYEELLVLHKQEMPTVSSANATFTPGAEPEQDSNASSAVTPAQNSTP